MPGYQEGFVDRLNRNLFCPLCRLPMRDPVQITACSHKFCDTCLQEYLSEGIFQCPEDDLPLDYAKIYPDPSVQLEVANSLVRCRYYKEGCRWIDKLQNLKAHVDTCRYEIIPCPNHCCAVVASISMDDHMQYTCRRRRVVCEFCGKEFSGEAMENHQGSCPFEIVWCENKCGARLQRRFLSNHMKNECHKRTSSCPYCKKQFVHETLQGHFHHCPRFPVACPNRCDPVKIAREDVDLHVQEKCPSSSAKCPFWDVGCKHLCPRFSLENHLKDTTKVHLHLVCQLAMAQQRKLNELTHHMQMLNRITDGQFLWKVTSITSRMSEAKMLVGHELKSDSFYTSRHGYHLGASLFLDGNGSGEGTHISVYIRIMPGEYDNLLDWPFQLPITFRILNQSSEPEKRVSIVESFIPDPTWKHFQKPRKGLDSLGFGYPRLISHDALWNSGFVKDDAIFLKIEVDNTTFIAP